MAKGRASFMKRERERQRTERAAVKRERRTQREPGENEGPRVATREDLDGYGLDREDGADDVEASSSSLSQSRG